MGQYSLSLKKAVSVKQISIDEEYILIINRFYLIIPNILHSRLLAVAVANLSPICSTLSLIFCPTLPFLTNITNP